MNIRELVERAYTTAKAKGWWENPSEVGTLFMLMTSELAEALEEWRNGHEPAQTYYNPEKPTKPEGIPSELADVVIRIADFCGHHGIDLEAAIAEKMAYNDTRAFRHGGKRA